MRYQGAEGSSRHFCKGYSSHEAEISQAGNLELKAVSQSDVNIPRSADFRVLDASKHCFRSLRKTSWTLPLSLRYLVWEIGICILVEFAGLLDEISETEILRQTNRAWMMKVELLQK